MTEIFQLTSSTKNIVNYQCNMKDIDLINNQKNTTKNTPRSTALNKTYYTICNTQKLSDIFHSCLIGIPCSFLLLTGLM